MTPLPRVHRPCDRCPWRRDVSPGEFPACNYEALRVTAETSDGQPGPFDPMFACHKTPEGGERACAGWLAAVGRQHIGVRLAVAMRRLPVEALDPGKDWPELYASYEEMAAVQGGEKDGRGE